MTVQINQTGNEIGNWLQKHKHTQIIILHVSSKISENDSSTTSAQHLHLFSTSLVLRENEWTRGIHVFYVLVSPPISINFPNTFQSIRLIQPIPSLIWF